MNFTACEKQNAAKTGASISKVLNKETKASSKTFTWNPSSRNLNLHVQIWSFNLAPLKQNSTAQTCSLLHHIESHTTCVIHAESCRACLVRTSERHTKWSTNKQQGVESHVMPIKATNTNHSLAFHHLSMHLNVEPLSVTFEPWCGTLTWDLEPFEPLCRTLQNHLPGLRPAAPNQPPPFQAVREKMELRLWPKLVLPKVSSGHCTSRQIQDPLALEELFRWTRYHSRNVWMFGLVVLIVGGFSWICSLVGCRFLVTMTISNQNVSKKAALKNGKRIKPY